MNVFTIPAGTAFADLLVRGVIEEADTTRDPFALADITILVPTRRATRTLQESFARELGGERHFCRQIRPLGDVDEDEILFEAGRRRSVVPARHRSRAPPPSARLARRAMGPRRETVARARFQICSGRKPRAWPGAVYRRSSTRKTSIFQNSDRLQGAALAEHWRHVEGFPRDRARRMAEAHERRRRDESLPNAAISRFRHWRSDTATHPPRRRASLPRAQPAAFRPTANLLREIAPGLAQGAIVLPGLDRDLDEESAGRRNSTKVTRTSGCGNCSNTSASRGATCATGRRVAANAATRAGLLREALRPAPTTDAWRAIAVRAAAKTSRKVSTAFPSSRPETIPPKKPRRLRSSCARRIEQRRTHGRSGHTGSQSCAPRGGGAWPLVDRHRRFRRACGRSPNTPPGTFLSLIADAARRSAFAPVPLLALLKHPLAAAGRGSGRISPPCTRSRSSGALRGPRPDHRAWTALPKRSTPRARSEKNEAACRRGNSLRSPLGGKKLGKHTRPCSAAALQPP